MKHENFKGSIKDLPVGDSVIKKRDDGKIYETVVVDKKTDNEGYTMVFCNTTEVKEVK